MAKIVLVTCTYEASRKRVFGSHANTAHVWASGKVESGRSSDERMYFGEGTIYSYGSHFAIAHIVETSEGKVTLVNSDRYSSSTGKHQSYVNYAVSGKTYRLPKLTNIVRTLTILAGGACLPANTTRLHDEIGKYIAEYITRDNRDGMSFLSRIIGRDRSLDKWLREAEARREKAKLDEKIREQKAIALKAEIFAEMSDASFQIQIQTVVESFQYNRKERRNMTAGEKLAAFATELHRANVAAKSFCKPKIQAAVYARLKYVRGKAKEELRFQYASEELAKFRRWKTTFRAVLATGTIALYDRHNAETLVRIVEYFTTLNHVTSTIRAKLNNLARMARERLETIAANESRERMEREAKGRAEWLAGGTGDRYARYSDAMGRALVRAADVEREETGKIVAGTLETSHGANVPLIEAVKVFRMIRLCRAKGEGWKRNGATLPVGYYQVDAIDAEGNFIAGCHKFSFSEINRLASELGLAEIAPAMTAEHA